MPNKWRSTVSNEQQTNEALVIRAQDGGFYAIPWSVVEQGRIPQDQVPDLGSTADVQGFSAGVLLPFSQEGSVYALPPEVIEQFRLPEDQAAEVDAALSDDVGGFNQGQGHAYGQLGGHGGPPVFGNVTIINQYNTQIGYNIAFGSPGAILSVTNLGLNSASA
jgi:hypothetical protein